MALEDQYRDKKSARKRAKEEAAKDAWQDRDRLTIAEEKAERAERRKRRLEREAAQQGEGSGKQ